jgi:exopolyphosphatase/pppGpp-phosphohydrolase
MSLFGFGKQTRTITIDEQGNTIDTTRDDQKRVVAETLSEARAQVQRAMEEVRAESKKNAKNPNHRWAAALLGISERLSESYENLRGAETIQDAAYHKAVVMQGLAEWGDMYDAAHKGESDYQGTVPIC